jgi:hypothetical protein
MDFQALKKVLEDGKIEKSKDIPKPPKYLSKQGKLIYYACAKPHLVTPRAINLYLSFCQFTDTFFQTPDEMTLQSIIRFYREFKFKPLIVKRFNLKEWKKQNKF